MEVLIILLAIIGLVAVVHAIVKRVKGSDPVSSADDTWDPSDIDDMPVVMTPELEAVFECAQAANVSAGYVEHASELRKNADFRRGLARAKKNDISAETLGNWFSSESAMVGCIAAEAARTRKDGKGACDSIMPALAWAGPDAIYFGLQCLAEKTPPSEPLIMPVLVQLSYQLSDEKIASYVREFVNARYDAGDVPRSQQHEGYLSLDQFAELEKFANSLEGEPGELVQQEVAQLEGSSMDAEFLRSVGSVWDDKKVDAARDIIENDSLMKAVKKAELSVTETRPRSLLLVGEEGVGKSTIVTMLACRLKEQGWTIFEAGHSELIAGQQYIGQLEERVQALLRELRAGKRILWIVPDFQNLAFSGLHKYSPVSVLDTVLPFVQSGEVTIIGAVEPAA